jgi:hypothetical protein
MGTNFDKTLAILDDNKSLTAIAIKSMAIDMDKTLEGLDKRFDKIEAVGDKRHQELLTAIEGLRKNTELTLSTFKDTEAIKSENIANKLNQKFTDIESKLDKKIDKDEVNSKFTKLRIVMFFSENPTYLYISVIGLITLMVFAGISDVLKFIK